MHPETKKLVDHISRIEGQLAAIKKALQDPVPECEKAALTLKAASRSFSTLRMSFVACFLEQKFSVKKKEEDSLYQALINVINA